MKTVDVIIPTYKPDSSFLTLVEKLCRQTYPISRIIVMNTEEKYYESLVYGAKVTEEYKEKIQVAHVSKWEFDHGDTRNKGVKRSEADIVVMMTQDAMPATDDLIEQLVNALSQENTAVAYARQLPREDSTLLEGLTRRYNYPETAHVQTLEDLPKKGIKTYFCSNVCAAYHREIFWRLGGFVHPAIFNEDMIYAAKAIQAGYQVVYEAKAKVFHSHQYTNGQQFRRNFDIGVSQADHPDIFENAPSVGEGKQMVKEVGKTLQEQKKWALLLHFWAQCGFKLFGYQLGKHYHFLPQAIVLKCTLSPAYWKKR